MKFSKLEFTRDWNNPADFPTIQNDEAIVRADMQQLHNETKLALNTLVDEIQLFADTLEKMFGEVTSIVDILGVDHTSIPTSQAVRDAIDELAERVAALEGET